MKLAVVLATVVSVAAGMTHANTKPPLCIQQNCDIHLLKIPEAASAA